MKILCVCGLGQGSSLILRMNVETVLSQMSIRADVENTDVSTAASMSSDYIITGNELAQSLGSGNAKVLIVNNYFDLVEIRQTLQSALINE